MHPVMAFGKGTTVATARQETKTPACLTTTLYDLIAALQAMVGPEDDTLVVATVMYLVQSRRLIWLQPHGGRCCEVHGAGTLPSSDQDRWAVLPKMKHSEKARPSCSTTDFV